MRSLGLACVAALLVCPPAEARYPNAILAGSGARLLLSVPRAPSLTPVPEARVVTASGPGQAGYVHFFELTAPDGETETQVGIETYDQRIAWSFPGLGVHVSDFVRDGEIAAGGKRYRIRHLYGIRPFRDERRMTALQESLALRISALVDDATAYCNDPESRDRFCMSCLGFVLQVLFPGPHPAPAQLPRDFMRSADDLYYTTQDLLLWLTGIEALPTREARLQRVEQMHIPGALREDLLELIAGIDPADRVPATLGAPARASRTVAASSPQPKGKGFSRRFGPRRL